MFKIFHGYHLVESYHEWKKAHRVDDKTVSRAIRLIIAAVAALVVWCLPVENWIDGMTNGESSRKIENVDQHLRNAQKRVNKRK